MRGVVLDGFVPGRVDPSLEVVQGHWHRILTALQAWPLALKLLIMPVTLLADYGPRILLPIAEWNSLAVLGATFVIALVGGGVIALAKGYRVAALALLWYPIAILPVSNFLLPIGVLLAERTLYLPSVAISFALAALYAAGTRNPARTKLIQIAVVAMVTVFAIRSFVRVPAWTSTDSILFALVRDRPDAFRGQWHVARHHRENGRPEAALDSYDEAFRLWPYREGLTQETAGYATSQGRAAYARDIAIFGAGRWRENVIFHRLAAANSLDLGDTTTAKQVLSSALQLHPDDSLLNQMWRAATPKTSQ
jgi:tetratricopeptide (TPR) repeat protein